MMSKKRKIIRTEKLLNLGISLICLTFFYACNKEKTRIEQEPLIPLDNALIFNIQGIEDAEDLYDHEKQTTNAKAIRMPTENKVSFRSKIVSLGNVDAIMEVTEAIPSAYPGKPINRRIQSDRAVNHQKALRADRNISALGDGIRYRIVIYKADNAGNPVAYVGQEEGIIGSKDLAIGVSKGTTYHLYAYSYNNTSPIDSFEISKASVPVLPSANSLSTRQDFSFATGIVKTSDQSNSKNMINHIVLTRKTARFIVEVNSRGMFAAVSYASLKFKNSSGLIKADFNLADSSYSNLTDQIESYHVYNHNTASYSVPVGVDSVPEVDWKKRYTFYTATDGTTARGLSISIDTMTITSERLAEADGHPVKVDRQFYNKTFEFSPFVAQAGKSYFIAIKLIESAIPMGTAHWARANIYRVVPGPQRPDGYWDYRLRYDNPLFHTIQSVPMIEYFTSDIYATGINKDKNICELLYPDDTWTIPTVTDFNSLSRTNPPQNKTIINNGWYIYMEPLTEVPGIPSYPNGDLVFAPVGYKPTESGSTISYYPNSATQYNQTKGYWRTMTPSRFARLNFNANTSGSHFESLLTNSAILANVRCIRKS